MSDQRRSTGCRPNPRPPKPGPRPWDTPDGSPWRRTAIRQEHPWVPSSEGGRTRAATLKRDGRAQPYRPICTGVSAQVTQLAPK
ncbi:hypothetical protein STRIP9103_06798 [Streptomyces ipomoeae 91-03]|uniref:Uncharacterized protein n=1 Tax=Streptomyces ipomoeae 91-03 TaxID=698759 RepID=L1L1H9_9ACTN|nr:hypothetical protein STRIP9103_06798 [Streptomyces ipomoeae 91-03]